VTIKFLTFNSGHVGWLAWSSDITVKADPLKMIQANVGLNWSSIFREEDLLVVRVNYNHFFKPSTQYKKHTIELSLALNCGVWG
jgi:hypothetical protein